MYIFGSWTKPNSISHAIGFKYENDGTYDDTQRVLFTDGNKIAFEEDIDYLTGPKEILFDILNDSIFQTKGYYIPSDVTFKIRKNTGGDFSDYELIHAKIRN